MSTALIVVDVQNDFTEGGALPVTGGAAVATHISDYLAANPNRYSLVVATRDWHEPLPDTNDGHFAADGQPDYATTWPVHCVADSDGAQYHPALRLPPLAVHVLKGEGRQDYSGFAGRCLGQGSVTAGQLRLADVLERAGITGVDIVGLATDHCVTATALDALAEGLSVRVLTDLTAGVAAATTISALTRLVNAGATLTTSKDAA